MKKFLEVKPTNTELFRAIILFGANVQSYKFALGASLLELAKSDKTFVTLSDLAEPFAYHLCEHLKTGKVQGTARSSRFIEACKSYNTGAIEKQELLDTTERLGFNNVIDAFHNVSNAEIPTRFFADDRKTKKGITISDELLALAKDNQFASLSAEVQSRWNLVETAWTLKLSPSLLNVAYDSDAQLFYIENNSVRKTNITSAKNALNGYQKGHCFYCMREISLDNCDIDHFFPHVLLRKGQTDVNLDGVFNLVLTCTDCNRGQGGKFHLVPKLKYLEQLNVRNNFLIHSHHPLRDTLINQTGDTEAQRASFLQQRYKEAKLALVHDWEPATEFERCF